MCAAFLGVSAISSPVKQMPFLTPTVLYLVVILHADTKEEEEEHEEDWDGGGSGDNSVVIVANGTLC